MHPTFPINHYPSSRNQRNKRYETLYNGYHGIHDHKMVEANLSRFQRLYPRGMKNGLHKVPKNKILYRESLLPAVHPPCCWRIVRRNQSSSRHSALHDDLPAKMESGSANLARKHLKMWKPCSWKSVVKGLKEASWLTSATKPTDFKVVFKIVSLTGCFWVPPTSHIMHSLAQDASVSASKFL